MTTTLTNESTFSLVGGEISGGTIDNTLVASAFVVNGGTLNNLTAEQSGSALSALELQPSGGDLSGVTIPAGSAIDGTEASNSNVNITNGLTLNGTLDLGSPVTANTYGRLYFVGTQTLAGSGTLSLGGSTNNSVYSEDNGSAATLTIASGITIQGGYGQVDGLNADSSITNNGKINSATANDIVYLLPGSTSGTVH